MEGNSISLIIASGLKSAKMPKHELASKLGVSAAAVSQWVSGKALPSSDKLVEIIRILDLAGELFPEQKQNAPPADRSIEARLAALEDRLSRPVTVTTENRSLIELLERRLAALEDVLKRQHQTITNHVGMVNGHGMGAGTVEIRE